MEGRAKKEDRMDNEIRLIFPHAKHLNDFWLLSAAMTTYRGGLRYQGHVVQHEPLMESLPRAADSF